MSVDSSTVESDLQKDPFAIEGIAPKARGFSPAAGAYEPGYFKAEQSGPETKISPQKNNEGMNIAGEKTVSLTFENGKSLVRVGRTEVSGLGYGKVFGVDLTEERLVPLVEGEHSFGGKVLIFPVRNEGMGVVPILWLDSKEKKEKVVRVLTPIFGRITAQRRDTEARAIGMVK